MRDAERLRSLTGRLSEEKRILREYVARKERKIREVQEAQLLHMAYVLNNKLLSMAEVRRITGKTPDTIRKQVREVNEVTYKQIRGETR